MTLPTRKVDGEKFLQILFTVDRGRRLASQLGVIDSLRGRYKTTIGSYKRLQADSNYQHRFLDTIFCMDNNKEYLEYMYMGGTS